MLKIVSSIFQDTWLRVYICSFTKRDFKFDSLKWMELTFWGCLARPTDRRWRARCWCSCSSRGRQECGGAAIRPFEYPRPGRLSFARPKLVLQLSHRECDPITKTIDTKLATHSCKLLSSRLKVCVFRFGINWSTRSKNAQNSIQRRVCRLQVGRTWSSTQRACRL